MWARSSTSAAAVAAAALLAVGGCGDDDDHEAFVPDECPGIADLSSATGMTFSVHEGADPPFEGQNEIGRYCDYEYADPAADPGAGQPLLRIEYYVGAVDDETFAKHVSNTEVFRGTCSPVELTGARACAVGDDSRRFLIHTKQSVVELLVNGGPSSLEVGTAVAQLVVDQFPEA